MKNITILFCLFTSVTNLFLPTSFAALPKVQNDSRTLLQDILNLPSQNRLSIASQQGGRFYQDLLALSFSDKEPMSMRWKALTLAAQVGQQKAVPELKKASRHSLWYMRNAALVAMNEINKDEAYDMARTLLKDKALVVRSAAAEILSQFKNPSVRDLFWEELYQDYNKKKNQSLWIRGQILGYLSQHPQAHERSLFASLLKDQDLSVQKESIHALEKITGKVLGTNEMSLTKKVSLWQSETSSAKK